MQSGRSVRLDRVVSRYHDHSIGHLHSIDVYGWIKSRLREIYRDEMNMVDALRQGIHEL